MRGMTKPARRLHNAAFAVTRWVGSVQSIIAHTIAFTASFAAVWLGVLSFDRMLLVLTTILSLEAIYLAIFIQMTVNQTTASLEEVEQDIDEIQEDVEEIQEDVDEIQEDVGEMQEDMQEMTDEDGESKTLAEIHSALQTLLRDVEKLQKDASSRAQSTDIS